MNKIQVLDCTLRDGGYCNQWQFGLENSKKIIKNLLEAKIDIIECGFLTKQVVYKQDITRFSKLSQVEKLLLGQTKEKIYTVMVNFGEYPIEEIPKYKNGLVNGIRVAFHKKDKEEALVFCKQVKEKGYLVFIQPMVSLNYTDKEFLDLVVQINQIQPYACYIVDSFGMMKKKEMLRFFYLTDHNLSLKIAIGFHAHNNLQLSYSNSQVLVEQQTKRELIIDTSIMGMGRGAGNLNTELFLSYLKEMGIEKYQVAPLLQVIDEVITSFYQKNPWGYTLPNYLSAIYNTHPNYAMYLSEKNTLTIEGIDQIFSRMEEEKRILYDKAYIEKLYLCYMMEGKGNKEHLKEFSERLKKKKVLLVAPGRSVEEEKEKVIDFISREDILSISINFEYPYIVTDYIFVSNLRRYREVKKMAVRKAERLIVTSNIVAEEAYIQTEYAGLRNEIEGVRENAGIMAITFLMQLGVKELYLAGMDGYLWDMEQNYAKEEMQLRTRKETIRAMNKGMNQLLRQYAEQISIVFITKEKQLSVKKGREEENETKGKI